MLLVQRLVQLRVLVHGPVVPIPDNILDHDDCADALSESGPGSGETEELGPAAEKEVVEGGVLEEVEEVAAFDEGCASEASELMRLRSM